MYNELTSTMLCYNIGKQLVKIDPERFDLNEINYIDIMEIALLTLYNDLINEQKLNLITSPKELDVNIIRYRDDLFDIEHKLQKIIYLERY